MRGKVRSRRLVTGVALLGALGMLLSGCGGEDALPEPDDSPVSSPTAGDGDGAAGDPGDALFFYPPAEGATLVYDTSGPVGGSSEVTVDSVSSGDDGQTVAVTEVATGAGEPVPVQRTFHTGADGSLTIDAAGFGASAPGMRVTATGDDVFIPAISELESGDTSTGETFVEFEGAGFTGRADVTYTVTGGGYTSVTVPAGSFDVYLVVLDLTLESDLVGSIEGSAQYWFLPGFGLLRQETDTAGSVLVAELSDASVPVA